MESDSRPPGEDDSSKMQVVGDIPREPVAFQGRGELLAYLNLALQDQRGAAVCTLIGGRGVGKTQLAAAYARRCIADGWPLVAWIIAEDSGQLVAGLADLADAVGVRGPVQDVELAALSVRKWLEHLAAPSLLVLDNAVDPDNIRRWLPRAGRTQTVITSTHGSFSLLGAPIEVGVFSSQEAMNFLRNRSGCRG
jgi:hypothetical protein